MLNKKNTDIRIRLILICLILVAGFCESYGTIETDSVNNGLVGRWEFDEGTGRDLSHNGADARLNGTKIYSLGNGRSCLELMPETGPVIIPVGKNSPLAISEGTICFWLNVGWTRTDFLSFNNGAVQLYVYRGDFQVRFKGENEFNYGSGILDYNWPKYDMREWAFYGHPDAAVHDSRWHHFAVSYDTGEECIKGWRDGELIAVVDLSEVDIEPLRREGLTHITIGEDFAGYMDDLRIYEKVLWEPIFVTYITRQNQYLRTVSIQIPPTKPRLYTNIKRRTVAFTGHGFSTIRHLILRSATCLRPL